MKFKTNKQKGNTGIGIAIGYFMSNGYIVSIPINDTQDYDLIVDINNNLSKIQVKATGYKTKYGVYVASLRSRGGTKGVTYKTVLETNIDYVFIFSADKRMWLIPHKELNQINSINLGKDKDKFLVS
jgi:hypothetical protein